MERWKDCLAALVPHYDRNGGNATLVYTTAGDLFEDRRTVRWNLRRLARCFSVDLEAARQKQANFLGRLQGVPLPLSAALVLVPLKTREAVGKNDGCHAYVNPAAVVDSRQCAAGPARALLTLPGGHHIPCLYSSRTVRKRLRDGQIVLERFRAEMLPGVSPRRPAAALPAEYWRLLECLILSVLENKAAE